MKIKDFHAANVIEKEVYKGKPGAVPDISSEWQIVCRYVYYLLAGENLIFAIRRV